MPLHYKGLVPVNKLIRGDDLAELIDLKVGMSINNISPWLSFQSEQCTFFVASRCFRNHVAWKDLDDVEVVDGFQGIEIGNNSYAIRLLTHQDWQDVFHTKHLASESFLAAKDMHIGKQFNGGLSWCRGTQQGITRLQPVRWSDDTSAACVDYIDPHTRSDLVGWRPVLVLVT